jgi:hypothetical protein
MRRLGQIPAILAVLLAGVRGYGQAGAATPPSAVDSETPPAVRLSTTSEVTVVASGDEASSDPSAQTYAIQWPFLKQVGTRACLRSAP